MSENDLVELEEEEQEAFAELDMTGIFNCRNCRWWYGPEHPTYTANEREAVLNLRGPVKKVNKWKAGLELDPWEVIMEGECRRHSPTAGGEAAEGRFPLTMWIDYCGDHEDADEVE